MPKAGPIPTRKPTTRSVSARGLSFALAGAEKPYDAWRFGGGQVKLERPNHNPFKGL